MSRAPSPYRRFSVGRVVATFSSTSAPIVFAFAVLESSRLASGLAVALTFQTVGQIVALFASGVVVDRFDRRRVIVATQFINAGLWGTLFALLLADVTSASAFAVIAVLLGANAGFNGPALQAVLPQLVTRDEIRQKLAALRIATNTVAVGGPAVTGALVGTIGPGGAAGVLGVANLVSGISLQALPALRRRERPTLLHDLRTASKDLLGARWFLVSIIGCAAMNVSWAGFYQLSGPMLFQNRASSGSVAWGVVSAALGVGLVLGGVFFRRWTPRSPRSTPLVLLAGKALPIGALALGLPLMLVAAASCIAGFLLECFAINFYVEMERTFTETTLGKMLSVDAVVGTAFVPVGYALNGVAASRGTLDTDGMIAAGATVLVALTGGFVIARIQRGRASENMVQA